MAHSNRVLCDEAYYWFFRNFNHQLLLNPRSNDFASLRKTLSSGGMRFTEQSLQLQRERIRQALQRNVGEAMSFVRLINQTQGVWRKLHVVFSSMQDDVLRKHWRELVRNAMQPGIVIAALLGFRQGTWQHRLAMRLCKCPQAWHPASSEEGTVSEAFLNRLSDIFAAVEEAFCTEENLRKSRGKDKKGGMDESELQKQLNSEYNRGRNEQEQKGAAERKRLAAELKETKRQLEEAQQQLSQLGQRHAASQQNHLRELDNCADAARQHYERQLDEFLRQTFLFDAGVAGASGQESAATGDIIRQLRSATAAQLALNQKAGTKNALRQQRRELTAALDELRAAVDDSVLAAKNVAGVIQSAEQQLAAINRRLQEAGEPVTSEHLAYSLAFAQFEAYIQSIKLDDEADGLLREGSAFVQQALEHELLTDKESKGLQKLINERLAMLNEQRRVQMRLKAKAEREAADTVSAPEPISIMQLGRFIGDMHKVTIIFDGYNTMKRNEPWKSYEQQRFFDVARYEFVATIKRQAHFFQQVELVFDGRGTTMTIEKDADVANVNLIYSAYIHGEHDADNCIIERARTLRTNCPDALIWVVTNDFGLRKQLHDTCDAFVDTTAIPAFFH